MFIFNGKNYQDEKDWCNTYAHKKHPSNFKGKQFFTTNISNGVCYYESKKMHMCSHLLFKQLCRDF